MSNPYHLPDETFDTLIIGTGITESIVAAYFILNNKKELYRG
jgi:RAB protein geranylgeranyltransferase component A